MPTHRLVDAAEVLGVSDDTLRRWVEAGRLSANRSGGRVMVNGLDVARVAEELMTEQATQRSSSVSARNSLRGVVTRVVRDTVMAQVELACGPYRIISLMSAEAADDLGLERGVMALASVKSTNVVVERA